jgi:hypothetical protein
MVGQSGEEGVEVCAPLMLLAVVFVVSTLASSVEEEESATEGGVRQGWDCSNCCRPSAFSC